MPKVINFLQMKVRYESQQLGSRDEAHRMPIATRLGQNQEKLANYLASTNLPLGQLVSAEKGDFGILRPETVTQVVGQNETIVHLGTFFFDVQGCDSASIAKTGKIDCPLVVTDQRDFMLKNGKTFQAMIAKPLDWKAVIKAYKSLMSSEEKLAPQVPQ